MVVIFYEFHCFPRKPAITEVQKAENPSLKRVPFLDQRLKANDTLREFVNLDGVGHLISVPFLADLSHKTFVLPSFLP